MIQAQQKWTIAPVPNAGGYPGSPYFKITIAATDRALAATDDAELVAVPTFTGAPEQLWRIEQLSDGTYRIMPKAIPNSKETMFLCVNSTIGAGDLMRKKIAAAAQSETEGTQFEPPTPGLEFMARFEVNLDAPVLELGQMKRWKAPYHSNHRRQVHRTAAERDNP
jgi:hypothetical protein